MVVGRTRFDKDIKGNSKEKKKKIGLRKTDERGT